MTRPRETQEDIPRLISDIDELVSLLSGAKDIDFEASLRFLTILNGKPELKFKRFSQRIRRRLNVAERNDKKILIEWIRSLMNLIDTSELSRFSPGEKIILGKSDLNNLSIQELQNTLRKISYYLFFKEYKTYINERRGNFQITVGVSGAIFSILEGI